ncbi:MAG: 5-formyltetrahydrofolate cyclo-ligase [Oscillospiraceae bacterium]|nr:5-formyltetrahydrofolate cyclo-ligase [Oscillospiraceae bacterium]
MALTKAELRRLYPPVSDGGSAARTLTGRWEANGFPKSVFCYIGIKGECVTVPILCFCLRYGIPLAVPLCEKNGMMTARRVTGFSGFRRGPLGIPAPAPDAEVMEDPDVTVVPGLAFDRDGYRLGRGGGYYDRWLAGRVCRTVGLCLPGRLLDRLPRDPWDVPVQIVETGR